VLEFGLFVVVGRVAGVDLALIILVIKVCTSLAA
jgi:hypothetical protein